MSELISIAAGLGIGWLLFKFIGPLKDMKDSIDHGSARVNGMAKQIEEDLALFNKQRKQAKKGAK